MITFCDLILFFCIQNMTILAWIHITIVHEYTPTTKKFFIVGNCVADDKKYKKIPYEQNNSVVFRDKKHQVREKVFPVSQNNTE